MKTVYRKSSLALAFVLVVCGIAAGITISSRLGVMNTSSAVDAVGEGAAPPAIDVPPALTAISGGLADIAGAIIPSVVNISTTKTVKQQSPVSPFFDDPLFRRFFGDPQGGRQWEFRQKSLGSGVIVSPDGYIVTNNHVVDGADDIKVILSDKREFKGTVVGSDPRSDVAVIKIDASGLPAAAWGDSDKLRPGEMVMAVGSPFGLSRTVTLGIVSAIGRANVGITDYEDFIQTDAAINPGNSGGALVNMKGEIVGINSAILSRSGGNQGIGFAVPSRMARQVMDSLIKNGKVTRAWLGVSVQDLTPQLAKQFGVEGLKGALVAEVMDKSPAGKAGLKMGDVIVSYDGRDVEDSAHLRNSVASSGVGRDVGITVIRDKKKLGLTVELGELPGVPGAAEGGAAAATESPLAGVSVSGLTPELRHGLGLGDNTRGVAVVSVERMSAAAGAGLLKGDVIVSVNKEDVPDVESYNARVRGLPKDEPVLLLVNRKGSVFWLSIAPLD